MKDLRQILLTALVPALKTATGKNVYTRMPKAANVAYPYIYVGDIYDKEIGPKTSYMYEYDVQIAIVHKDLNDLSALYTDLDTVKGIVTNRTPFTLTGGFVVDSCTLGASNTNDFETDTGTEHLGVVRLLFYIR